MSRAIAIAFLCACGSSPAGNDGGTDASIDVVVDSSADVIVPKDATPDVAPVDAAPDVVDAGCVGAGTPTTVFSGAETAKTDLMVVDGTNVFWTQYDTQYDSLYTCPIASCTTPTLLTYSFVPTYITALAVDANEVWFVQGTSIHRASKTTFALNTTTFAPSDSSAMLALDANNVYWTNLTFGTVQACPKSGCTTPATLAQSQTSPDGIASDGVNVYWTNAAKTTGSVMKCAVGGCGQSPTQLAGNQVEPERIATDGTNVYWVDEDATNGTIEACPITGCTTPTTLAIGQPGTGSIATDGTNVYWANSLDRVMRCATTGCAQTPTAMRCHNAAGTLALDGAHVIWDDHVQTAILSLPK